MLIYMESRRRDRYKTYAGELTTKSFYIGTINTADEKRKEAALLKAVEFRDAAAISYETEKTNARRKSVIRNYPPHKSTDA